MFLILKFTKEKLQSDDGEHTLILGVVTSQRSCTVEDAVACVQAAVGSGSGYGRFPGLTVQGTAENCR